MTRAAQARLLSGEGRKDDTAFGLRIRHQPRQFQHHGDARSIVVGARMQLPFGAGARIRPAETEMIVVRGNDQRLAVQSRVRTRQHGDHVLGRDRRAGFARHVERLEIAVVAAARPGVSGDRPRRSKRSAI